MSFPSSPVNGQQVTVNDILYTYNGTKTAWIRTTAVSETLSANNFVANTATIAGNVVAGNVIANNLIGNLISATGSIEGALFVENSILNLESGTSNLRIHNNDDVTISAGGTANIAVFTSSNIYVSGSVLPSANVTYDLGSPNQRWRDGWFSGTTIHIGTESMSVSENGTWAFTSGGATVELGAEAVFNPPSANIAGNVAATNYLFANGTPLMTVVNSMIGTANVDLKSYVDSVDITKANLSGAIFTGAVSITNTTPSTGEGTGALVVSGGASFGGNVYISGNLQVSGTETIFNANNLNITDSLIYLADDNTGDVLDIGFVGSFTNPGYQHTGFARDATDGVWKLFANVVAEPTTTIDFTNATYSNLRVGNLITTGVTYANGQSILTNVESAITTANTNMKGYVDGQISTTTSAITTANTNMKGYVDNGLSSLSSNRINASASNVTVTASFVNVAINSSNVATFSSTGLEVLTTTASTNTTNGALIVDGGAGIAGNINAGNVTATNLTGTLLTASQTNITAVGNITTGTWNATTIATNRGGTGLTSFNHVTNGSAVFTSGTNTLTTGVLPVSGGGTGTNSVTGTGSVVLNISPGFSTSISTPSIINNGTNGVGNIGASGQGFNTVFARATSAQYADLAEVYTSDRNYIPGTVVVFGGTSEVTVSLTSHDPSVAGVVSTNPAYLMNDSVEGIAVALQGRVPCRVLGPVVKGDRVVTSNVRGVAERLDMSKYQPGCIIGKTLDSVPDGEIATIEVVVGRN